jgi:ketosteroid isomerase-like protein
MTKLKISLSTTSVFLGTAIVFMAMAAEKEKIESISFIPSATKLSVAECEVWKREKSFALSLAEHNAEAFSEHLYADAIFINGSEKPSRGSSEITSDWRNLISGSSTRLGWYPDVVMIGGEPNIAISRGPFWIERADPKAMPRYLVGTYQTIWAKNANGLWQVLYNGGGPSPTAATLEDVNKIKKSLPANCPS